MERKVKAKKKTKAKKLRARVKNVAPKTQSQIDQHLSTILFSGETVDINQPLVLPDVVVFDTQIAAVAAVPIKNKHWLSRLFNFR